MLAQDFLQVIKRQRVTEAALLRKLQQRIPQLPDGHLSVKSRGDTHYFYRVLSHQGRKTYYPIGDWYDGKDALIQELADKSAIDHGYRQCQQNLSALQKLCDTYRPYDPAALPHAAWMSSAVYMPGDICAAEWIGASYPGNSAFSEHRIHPTKTGLLVRSKSEVMIANALIEHNIPFRYECALPCGENTLYPDFTILRQSDRREILWEHFGLLDSVPYVEHMLQKLLQYGKSSYYPGCNLIFTMETPAHPLTLTTISNTIREWDLA